MADKLLDVEDTGNPCLELMLCVGEGVCVMREGGVCGEESVCMWSREEGVVGEGVW